MKLTEKIKAVTDTVSIMAWTMVAIIILTKESNKPKQ